MTVQTNSNSTTTLDRQRGLHQTPLLLLAFLIFCVFCGAGIAICFVLFKADEAAMEEEALDLAMETGDFFRNKLDQAILPLFSLSQFVTNLNIFRKLPEQIGVVGALGALPMLDDKYHRNVTGVCDDPELVQQFIEIASGIKKHAGMEGVLVNIQLAPQGVICLLHPMNNTEDFEDGKFLDSTGAWGLDLFHDPFMKYIALSSIKTEQVGIAGPLPLKQCPTCDPFFIARLPIVDEQHDIWVDGKPYKRWGFATALIDWTKLVRESQIHEQFENSYFEFQLTRTDRNLNQATGLYDEQVIVLAESEGYHMQDNYWKVSTTLETTNNQWEMTILYDHSNLSAWMAIVSAVCIVVSFFIAFLVYSVLVQKQIHSQMAADTSAQEAKVATERNITAYFAHELRNPLSALDSALRCIMVESEEMSPSTKELIDGMQACSSFMSSIMNNLLDVRKMEEGKMCLHFHAMSLRTVVEQTHTMMKTSVKPNVDFFVQVDTPKGKQWVFCDEHRIQQVLTNVVTNAIKYTLEGSITLKVSWSEDDMVQFECIDTGPGIPKSTQENLFERFVQRGGAPGTGLGLSIAKQIVTLFGGTIGFESDPTVRPGTTCRILVPLEVIAKEKQPTPRQLSQPSNSQPIHEPISILIVDDIKMNRNMLQRRILKAIAPNAIITTAETGEQALDIVLKTHRQSFDVIICDQYMEGAGGVLVGTDVIIAMRRHMVQSFIIGCSGNDLDDVFFEAGADMVWGKPLPTNAEIIDQWTREFQERKRINRRDDDKHLKDEELSS